MHIATFIKRSQFADYIYSAEIYFLQSFQFAEEAVLNNKHLICPFFFYRAEHDSTMSGTTMRCFAMIVFIFLVGFWDTLLLV